LHYSLTKHENKHYDQIHKDEDEEGQKKREAEREKLRGKLKVISREKEGRGKIFKRKSRHLESYKYRQTERMYGYMFLATAPKCTLFSVQSNYPRVRRVVVVCVNKTWPRLRTSPKAG